MVADLNSVTETELVDVATWRRLAESILQDNARRGGSLTNIPSDPRLFRNDSDWIDIPQAIRDRESQGRWDVPLTLWVQDTAWHDYFIRIRRGNDVFQQTISREVLDSPSLDVLEYMSREMGRVLRIDSRYVSYALHQLLIVESSGRHSLRCDYRVPIRVEESPHSQWTREVGYDTSARFDVVPNISVNRDDSVDWDFSNFNNTFLEQQVTMRFNEEICRAFGIPEGILNESKQRVREREEADARAKQALIDHLDEKQKESFLEKGKFSCIGKWSGDTYNIQTGRNANVYRHSKNKKVTNYCLVQKGDVPLYDQLLTQKLLIENNEEMFLEKANNMSDPVRFTFNGIDLSNGISNFRIGVDWGVDVSPSTIVMPTL